MATNLGRLTINSSALFICDIQTKFARTIQYFSEIAAVSNRLSTAAQILNFPILVTEQYPQGLGHITPEISIGQSPVFAKTKFSMCIPEVNDWLQNNANVKNIILCGIEAHVCIQQTAFDLLECGYNVHIPVDAVSARTMTDRKYAFDRISKAGAFLTTADSVLFGLCGDAADQSFKSIRKLVFDPPSYSGL